MPGFVCSGDEYVKFLSDLRREIDLQSPGVSFQEVSHTAWDERSANPQPDPGPEPPDKQSTDHGKTIHNNAAKNLILYGTPGTGKTYSSVLNAFYNRMQIGDIIMSCYSSKTIDAIGVVTGEPEWHEEYQHYKRLRKVKWLVKDINEDIVDLNAGKTMTLQFSGMT
ncbi:hypothetical protein SDC9_144123 [bioreactor metagenome]|uniref:Uncharacterized protein n=1 Tax=bioreactor metagenome TaxID=1076179 RepID=A0A645E828_9ZZZZ